MKAKLKKMREDWVLYLMLLPGITFFVIFHVIPIIDMKLAFQDYRIIGENIWVGMKHFETLFNSSAFLDVLKNTVIISTMKISAKGMVFLICWPRLMPKYSLATTRHT